MSSERDLLQKIARLERLLDRAGAIEVPRIVRLKEPLVSTAWDGDAYSTTGKTLIDLSAVFGVPAGIKSVLVRINARDSGSAASSKVVFQLSPTTKPLAPVIARPAGLPNDYWAEAAGICPCNANGDIYYDCVASGARTMDVFIRVWGWEI